jgi:uncharacterized protein with NAD-binding domain and iron-sulfur cluster
MADEGISTVRVAVLGGGAAALATAFALTEAGGYDITVYQMGWRLGGKGATGRRLDGSGRDQEHGLHVLGGFYHNALGMLRSVYEAWAGVSRYPLRFDDVFIPQSLVHVMEEGPDGPFPVRFPFPENAKPLGREPTELDLISVAESILNWIMAQTSGRLTPRRGTDDLLARPDFVESIKAALSTVSAAALMAQREAQGELHAEAQTHPTLDLALSHLQRPDLTTRPPNAEHDPDYSILFEIGLVVARGIVVDGLWCKGFDAANGEEFAAWMTRHGLSRRALESSYFRCGYDYAFAYVDGDPKRRDAAAGAALRGFLRMVMTYNRSVFVHMYGGMGEIVFAPLYEVLKSRGVRFEFFHRVDEITLGADGRRVERVVGTVQNRPVGADYEPLQPYLGRWVWPDAPIDARLLHHPPWNGRPEHLYESPDMQPASAERFELIADEDFDVCVLAISVEALKTICKDFAAKHPPWRAMLASASTTPTISGQLWQAQTTAELGWPNGPTVLTANAPPFSTWADMSFLLPLETQKSRHISYFCGPYPRADYPVPSPTGDIGPAELARASGDAQRWLSDNLAELLPGAALPTSFAATGDADEFYVRVNSYPSDCYVLTVHGSVKDRLAPGASGIDNLFLAGDWTKNGYDIGSFETAVLSGLLCARAITGSADRFVGETDLVG